MVFSFSPATASLNDFPSALDRRNFSGNGFDRLLLRLLSRFRLVGVSSWVGEGSQPKAHRTAKRSSDQCFLNDRHRRKPPCLEAGQPVHVSCLPIVFIQNDLDLFVFFRRFQTTSVRHEQIRVDRVCTTAIISASIARNRFLRAALFSQGYTV
jgi:hypothetical protein